MVNRLSKSIPAALVFTVLIMLTLAFPLTAFADEDDELLSAGPKAASRVIISDYSVADGGLTAGKTCIATFTLHNVNENAAVNSVLVTGGIETGAPVVYVGVNQAYVPLIEPGGEAVVEFEYYTKNVDMTSIDSISVALTISYVDEGTEIERTNSVSLRLPVSESTPAVVSDADMHWQEPGTSGMNGFLDSGRMQMVYFVGLVVCGVGIGVLLFRKLKAARQ